MPKLLALVALVSGIALPATTQHRASERGRVERALLEQINSGPSGRVTRAVRCAGHDGLFACTLHGVDLTTLRARVVAHDGDFVVAWAPLRG